MVAPLCVTQSYMLGEGSTFVSQADVLFEEHYYGCGLARFAFYKVC
jgi:hypothetical protein